MEKDLLIIFVKNPQKGKVKTRLANTIGEEKALKIYEQLLETTEKAIENIRKTKRVYFSESIIEEKWQKTTKLIQKGSDLGEKMQDSFKKGFFDGFEKIVLIGSDLPEISEKTINESFDKLNEKDLVFGPAEDGGYYLIGMRKEHFFVFENKPWSQENLLQETLNEAESERVSYSLLRELNDIDTFEDLKKSTLWK